MPAGMPKLLPTGEVWRREFTTQIRVKTYGDTASASAAVAAATQAAALPSRGALQRPAPPMPARAAARDVAARGESSKK
jgi:hypothetical protein